MRTPLFRLAFVIVCLLAAMLTAAPVLGSNDPLFGKQWAISKIGAEAAWKTETGAGVRIAVIDSGVDLLHEDLSAAGKLVSGFDYFDGGSRLTEEEPVRAIA